MKKPSEPDKDWDFLRNQIIGLGDESHGKNYYSALKQSRNDLLRFRGVIEEIPDMIIILNMNDFILDLNKTAVRVFDRSQKLLLSSDIKELPGIPYEQMIELGPDYKVLRPDDTLGPTVFREMELRTVRHQHRSFRVLIGRDVTHRVKAEQNLLLMNESLENIIRARTASIEEKIEILKETQEQLVQSEKMAALGTLVAGVAHEINTPLGVGITASSALVSEVRTLQDSLKNDRVTQRQFDDFLEYLGESAHLIQVNLERAGALVQSFKLVAVDQSSELGRTIHLGEYLNEVIRSLYPQWKKHSVTLEGALDRAFFTVPGDWSQILTNLIVNSVSHGFKDFPGKGVILIKIYEEDNFVILEYRDNGCGLTKEQRERIFEPFYTTSRSTGGTGLGMHIVYNLVTLKMKGMISTLPMDVPGTAFLIRIPLESKTLEGSDPP